MATNFDQWKKLTNQQQKKIAATWDIKKDEGREIAEAVLKAFIASYGLNKSFQINEKIICGNSAWMILVRFLDDTILPKTFMGIAMGGYHIDHIDNGVSFKEVPPELWQRSKNLNKWSHVDCSGNLRQSKKSLSPLQLFLSF